MKTLYLKGISLHDACDVDSLIVREGPATVSSAVNRSTIAGQELNKPELRPNSQRPVWKAKQQLMALLKVG